MKKTYLLILTFSFMSGFMFSQKKETTRVIGDNPMTKAEAEYIYKLRNEIDELSRREMSIKGKLPTVVAMSGDCSNARDTDIYINQLEIAVNAYEKTEARGLCKQIDAKYKELNGKNSESSCDSYDRNLNKAKENLKMYRDCLRKKKSKEKQYDISIESLNSELELVSKEARNLEDVNTSYDVSFDDILSKRSSTRNTSNQLDDSFLNNDSEAETKDGNLDFLTQETVVQKNNANFKIDYKNGLQGVINPDTKKVLIPYKKWNIEKFQDGIAKVSIDIESKQICSCRLGNYNANVKEVGYVDENGNYIDGSRKVITGSFNYQAKLVIAKPGYDANKAKIRDESEKQECIKQGKQWKIEAKRRYL